MYPSQSNSYLTKVIKVQRWLTQPAKVETWNIRLNTPPTQPNTIQKLKKCPQTFHRARRTPNYKLHPLKTPTPNQKSDQFMQKERVFEPQKLQPTKKPTTPESHQPNVKKWKKEVTLPPREMVSTSTDTEPLESPMPTAPSLPRLVPPAGSGRTPAC